MKLLIDVGNTAVKLAYIDNNKLNLCGRFYLRSLSHGTLDKELVKFKEFDEVLIDSVVPNKNTLFDEYFNDRYHVQPTYTKVGDYPLIKIKIDDPKELGVDLYCDLVGAHYLCKDSNKPTIVVDLGTASKILLLDESGVFESCAIVPGIEMSKKMLSKSTALLPEADSKTIKKVTDARNTNDVINSSVYYGHVEMINGLINRFEKEINKECKYIITGGNAPLVIKDIKEPHIDCQELCFLGMWAIINNRG